ncbi:hypothetical protein EZS27_018568 [termite gut metagenome]|uniref:Uncharacterized protein n=1 Tax=termite gut metagenome TaxID=433724 RepID=A0A5J4RH57_9ZZZZ
METIKSLVDKLVQTESISKQVKILQETNTLFLTKYMLEIDDNFRLYPIEVEAYYYNEKNFPDTCVHQNKLQKNNFNKLYFHRASKEPDKSFLYDRGGVDVCISDDDNYYFGILIRSAWIKDEEEPICGPGRLTRYIVEHICGDKIIKKITEKEIVKIEELEKKSIIRVNDQTILR